MVKNNLALLYEKTGKYEDAERLYCDVLAAKPDEPGIMRNLADLYYRLRVYGAAREYYERIPDEKRDRALLVNLGHIHLSQGDRVSALNLWERAQILDPDNEDIAQDIAALRALESSSS